MKRVLVTGVFNVIHPGHVRMLRFARECGDYLIVAVQSDLSATPPIHVSGRLRLEGVLSNTYVDEAFLTNEGIEELIQRLQPSILVKGREHENTQNPESTLLEEYGGELLFDSGESFFSSLDLLRKEFYAAEGRHNQLPYDYMKRHKIDPLQLKKILKKFSKLRVAVVGDLIMDEYITCDSLGMSQEDPTIVVTPVDKQIFIGGAGIVAAHSASLGGEVNFISVAGDDLMYKKALSILTKVGVNTDILIDRHRPTTLKQRFRSKGKTLLRVSHLHQSDINQNLQSQVVENPEFK